MPRVFFVFDLAIFTRNEAHSLLFPNIVPKDDAKVRIFFVFLQKKSITMNKLSKIKVECPHCKEISYITHVQKNEKFENILFTCPYCGKQRNLTVYRVQN